MIDVVCAIIEEKSKVLVTQRGPEMDLSGQWEFPGGKIKSGESPEASLIREIREELHLHIQVNDRLQEEVHDYGNKTIRLIPFRCQLLSGNILLTEHAAFKWLLPDELSKLDWCAADVGIVKRYVSLVQS